MYLLDTHTLLWALADDPRLGRRAAALFDDGATPLLVSAASIWELAIKVSLGRLELDRDLAELATTELDRQGIPTLPVETRHAVAVRALPFHHRDPFDRLLAATALVDNLTLVSRDPVFAQYGVSTVW